MIFPFPLSNCSFTSFYLGFDVYEFISYVYGEIIKEYEYSIYVDDTKTFLIVFTNLLEYHLK